jgi:ferritin
MGQLSRSLNDLLNKQIASELHASLVYTQIQSYFKSLGLKNLGKLYKSESKTERYHAHKFEKYINQRIGGKVTLLPVEAPNISINSIQDIAKIRMDLEEQVTEQISEIMDLAMEEKSYIDLDFLNSMLHIQLKEEEESREFMDKVSMITTSEGLLQFDATYK